MPSKHFPKTHLRTNSGLACGKRGKSSLPRADVYDFRLLNVEERCSVCWLWLERFDAAHLAKPKGADVGQWMLMF